jgi:hypothetical protein
MTYDLFCQFQKAGDESTRDQPVMLDQFVLLWTPRAWVFALAVLLGVAALLLGTVRSEPSVLFLLLAAFLLVPGLFFLIRSFVRAGNPVDLT